MKRFCCFILLCIFLFSKTTYSQRLDTTPAIYAREAVVNRRPTTVSIEAAYSRVDIPACYTLLYGTASQLFTFLYNQKPN